MANPRHEMNRRDLLKTAVGGLGAALLLDDSLEAYPKAVNTNSSPSALKITDLRVATIVKPGPSPCPIIRIDTNQGVYGLGEVRDGASATYALFLKSRILGENPLQLDKIFRKIKQFGGHARQGGGVCAIEMALWDIAGKVYNAPVYAMVGGGKFRDKIRVYADTTESKDPKIYAQRMKERKEGMGITWLKMDLGVEMVSDTPGTVTVPSALTEWQATQLEHPLLAMEVTDKGIAMLEQYVAAVRDAVGMEIPLSMDHLGHLGVKSIIRLGKAYEKYNLSWMEDVIPWTYTDLLKQISDESPTPILTGEDIYLKEPFPRALREARGEQDSSRSGYLGRNSRNSQDRQHGGGIWRADGDALCRDAGQLHGQRALRRRHAQLSGAGKPLARRSLVVLHGAGGVKPPIVEHGWITVPDRPGLGVTLNEDVVRQHLMPDTGYFESTSQWDQERSWDRLWS